VIGVNEEGESSNEPFCDGTRASTKFSDRT